jgi:hypothetical protein
LSRKTAGRRNEVPASPRSFAIASVLAEASVATDAAETTAAGMDDAMTSSSSAPKLPLWVFVLADVALLSTAAIIAHDSARPLSQTATASIVGCVFVGILVLLVPLIVYYERQKNETLDDRQRALEALARTITSSAEQISIATGGLHEITEVAQKNLRLAEHLPHKLQEKIAEFQAQLTSANDDEKEEMEKELAELRAGETERLESISSQIAKTTAEFVKLEAAMHQHLTAANESVAKLSFGTASAIGKAQVAAEQALGQARIEAARTLGDAAGNAVKSIEAAKAGALSELAAKFDSLVARLDESVARLASAMEKMDAAPKSGAPETTPVSSDAPLSNANTALESPVPTVAASESPAHPPKRPRRPRREEPPVEASTPAPEPTASVEPTPEPTAEPTPANPPSASEPAVLPEPPPITSEKIPEIAPVAPSTAEPFSGNIAPAAASEPARPIRKRAARKADDAQPALGLDLPPADDQAGDSGPGVVERVLTSDGATRLLVTAYIGIGNRLFIRGAGPGLNWDKGVPLQFVSIGKWRWETADASAPVQFKLLKNDEQECTALGAQTLDPGYQQEVTAAF